jgi:MBG domain (YGX type)
MITRHLTKLSKKPDKHKNLSRLNMQKIIRRNWGLILGLLCAGLSLPVSAQTVIYNNTNTPVIVGGKQEVFDPGSVLGTSFEVANQVSLGGPANARLLQSFSVDYYATNSGGAFAGTPMIRVRFYINDGPATNGFPTPSTVFYDSGTFIIGSGTTGLGAHSVLYSVDQNDFPTEGAIPGAPLRIPTAATKTFTYSVQFSGLGAGDHIALPLASPPTVGANDGGSCGADGNYWEKDPSGWTYKSAFNGVPPIDFVAQMQAVTPAAPRTIVVVAVTANTSSLNTPTPLNSADTILITSGGTLFVDDNATIASLTIGDASSAGNVVFDTSSGHTLTVAGDVAFGAIGGFGGNTLDMTLNTTNLLQVGGNFLATGAGTFKAGVSTIEYNNTSPQNVTANIGGTGTLIQYKNVILSGLVSCPSTAGAIKNFANGVTIQGALIIKEKAAISGGSVSYGPLATLVYNGLLPQRTSSAEWPASPAVLNVPVTLNNAQGLTLDSDKTIGAVFPNSLALISGVLNNNGKTLTIKGNIQNATAITGAGLLVLNGSGNQTLSANGTYGNVTLANGAVTTMPTDMSGSQPIIAGRLSIQSGSKLALPTGTAHHVALLTYNSADKAPGTYGSTGSAAATIDPTVFDASGLGVLTVNAKPVPVITQVLSPTSIVFGSGPVTVSGTVTSSNSAAYGNGPRSGDIVSIVISNSLGNVTPQTNLVALDVSGNYQLNVNTTTLPVVVNPDHTLGGYVIISTYIGGINLGSKDSAPATLTVTPRTIGVFPNNAFKVYGDLDPILSFTTTNTLAIDPNPVNGTLQRAPGEIVGSYPINAGTIGVNANYTIFFDTTKTLTITPKTINITLISATKVYGQPDPAFTFTSSPPLVTGDAFSGGLIRTNTGSDAGSYFISLGTLTAGGNGGSNYTLTAVNAASLTITPLAITVTFDNQTKNYGAADPSPFTFTLSSPLVPGDTLVGLASRDAGQNVAGSPYIIRKGVMGIAPTNHNADYTLTFTTSGTLNINPIPVTVSALSPIKAYGAAVPPLVNYAGLITATQNGVTGQSAPATPATLNPAAPVITACTPAGTTNFTILTPGSDPNYALSLGTPLTGTITILPGPLTITADNRLMVANGSTFPTANYTVSYSGFSTACGDNAANSVAGTLLIGGSAVTATAAGVYQIVPSGLTSVKYNPTFASGLLTILAATGPVSTTNSATTWAGGGAYSWTINQANGTAGANPGWSLLVITNGTLTITATPSSTFRVDLVTLAGIQSGLMAKFDPTRPYTWEIARATTITGFSAANFTINAGAGFFINPVFGGQFTITQAAGPGGTQSIYINFIPVGSTGGNLVAIPSGYTVGTIGDTTTLLGYVDHSDVDTLYLQPSTNTIAPQGTVTINLNVANLHENIVGVDAYINFDSSSYIAAASGPGSPAVVAGGGVWTTVIVNTWNVGGDLDTILAVNLSNQTGTSADGTVAKITLTPTMTKVGPSRVVFRKDGGPGANGTGAIVTDVVPADGSAAVLPARVMTDLITILGTGVTPQIGTITATQVQPAFGSVIVKNGTGATRAQVVKTSGSATNTTFSGPVVITITASDAGVGLNGPPTLTLTNGSASVTLPGTLTGGTLANGTFTYNWNVTAATVPGTWKAQISASDTLIGSTPTLLPNAFTLEVNTTEVGGVVELESFAGTNRTVAFSTAPTGSSNQWTYPLTFTSGLLLPAGAFQNRAAFALDITTNVAQQDPLSTYLRYGAILNLTALVNNLTNASITATNVSTYIYKLLYGTTNNIDTLLSLATSLTSPARNVDVYVAGRLSPTTRTALNTYVATPTAANAPAAIKGVLNDFNNIVLTPTSIFDPFRFAGVTVTTSPTTGNTIATNRVLLNNAYPIYIPGKLNPVTAQGLSQYNPSGPNNQALTANILLDFDRLTTDSTLWPTPTLPPPAGFDQGLYNQTLFLSVTLSTNTLSLLTQSPAPIGDTLTLLNQYLLQDAFAGQYQKAPLTPATVTAAQTFLGGTTTSAAFDNTMATNLNALINGGTTIFDATRFAPVIGAVDPSSELGMLLTTNALTPAQQLRENRLLLELNYNASGTIVLSPGVLASYRLVQVPVAATTVKAKTAWNLQAAIGSLSFTAGVATANFVNDGVPGWTSGSDKYLRGGDLNGDNVVNLFDYNILRLNFGATGAAAAPADINGDGRVNINDYYILQINYGKSGE